VLQLQGVGLLAFCSNPPISPLEAKQEKSLGLKLGHRGGGRGPESLSN
jgi:hypothetical protein